MAFDHQAYNSRFLANPGQNDATQYGVTVLPAASTTAYWKVIGVHKLTGPENHGQSNVFLEVLNKDGVRLNNPVHWVGWTWDNRRPNEPARPVQLDKPLNEPAGNINLGFGQTATIWMIGPDLNQLPLSDKVMGLHTRHGNPPGDPGNYNGHHSFYVVFQETTPGQQPPDNPPSEEWRNGLTDLQKLIVANPQAVSDLIVEMRDLLDAA